MKTTIPQFSIETTRCNVEWMSCSSDCLNILIVQVLPLVMSYTFISVCDSPAAHVDVAGCTAVTNQQHGPFKCGLVSKATFCLAVPTTGLNPTLKLRKLLSVSLSQHGSASNNLPESYQLQTSARIKPFLN